MHPPECTRPDAPVATPLTRRTLNFKRRAECYTCYQPRPGGASAPSIAQPGVDPATGLFVVPANAVPSVVISGVENTVAEAELKFEIQNKAR